MQIITANASHLYQTRSLELISDSAVATALSRDSVATKVLQKRLAPQENDLVGVRLNLNLLKSQKIAVQTIHAGNGRGGHTRYKGFYNGAVLAYEKIVTLRLAYFNVSQSGRERIASGAVAKHPMASIDGHYVVPDEHNFDGIEVRFNPKALHAFCDMENRAIRYASEVTVYGHRAYVRGEVEYMTTLTAPPRAGDAPTETIYIDSIA